MQRPEVLAAYIQNVCQGVSVAGTGTTTTTDTATRRTGMTMTATRTCTTTTNGTEATFIPSLPMMSCTSSMRSQDGVLFTYPLGLAVRVFFHVDIVAMPIDVAAVSSAESIVSFVKNFEQSYGFAGCWFAT